MIVLTVMVLGSLGLLTLGAVTLAIGLESAAIIHLSRGAALAPSLGWTAPRRWYWGLFAGLLLYEIAQVLYANWLLPPSGDALGYHLPFAVEWIQRQRLSMPMPAAGSPNPPFYPLNSSILMAWLMLPMPGDVVVRFVQAPFLALLLLSAVWLGQSLGLGGTLSWVAATLVVSLPDVVRSIAVAGNDLILAALLFVSVASLAELWRRPTLWRLVLGVLALGLALGTKESALPYVATLGLAYVVAAAKGWHRLGWLLVARLWLVESAVVALAGGYSYLRNLAVMGNPFYPVTYQLRGHVIFPGLYATTTEWKQNHPYYPFDWAAFVVNSRTDFGYVVPLVAVLGAALAALVALRRRRVGPLVLLAWALLSFGLFWYVLPVHEARFLYAPVGWAAILGVWGWQAALPRWRSWLIVPMAALVGIGAVSVPKHSDALASLPYLLVGLLMVAGTVGLVAALSRLGPVAERRVATWGGVAAVVLALGILPVYSSLYESRRADQWPRVTDAASQAPLAWKWLAEATQSESAVVDVAGTNVYYPLYGPDLRNQVVRVNPDGSVAVYDWGHPGEQPGSPSRQAWLDSLSSEGVQYLFVVQDGATGDWPIEARWAASETTRFKPVLTEKGVENLGSGFMAADPGARRDGDSGARRAGHFPRDNESLRSGDQLGLRDICVRGGWPARRAGVPGVQRLSACRVPAVLPDSAGFLRPERPASRGDRAMAERRGVRADHLHLRYLVRPTHEPSVAYSAWPGLRGRLRPTDSGLNLHLVGAAADPPGRDLHPGDGALPGIAPVSAPGHLCGLRGAGNRDPLRRSHGHPDRRSPALD